MSTKTALPVKNTAATTSGQKGPVRAKPTPAADNAAKTTPANAKKTQPAATPKKAQAVVATKSAAPAKATPAPKTVVVKTTPTATLEGAAVTKKKVSRKYGAAGVSFGIYIKKLLKAVAAEGETPADGDDKKVVNISNSAAASIDQVVKTVAQTVSSYARENCSENKRNIVSVTDVTFGAAIVFPSKLHEVIFEGVKRIEEVSARLRKEAEEKAAAATATANASSAENGATTSDAKPENHPSRREAQYGLVFSVSGADKFIRNFKTTTLSVSNEAPVYLSLFIQNFVNHLLRHAVSQVRASKKVNMKPFHIFRAVEGDEVLSEFFSRLNVRMYGVGVVPHIFEELVPTKEEKNARYKKRAQAKASNPEEAAKDNSKKPKRHLPGTKALRYIRDSQGKIGLLMQKAPFDRVTREHIIPIVCEEIGIEYKDRSMYHFRDSMVEVIQQFVEDSAIDLLSKAQIVAIHCGRHGLQGTDVELAWKLTYPRIPFIQVESKPETEEKPATDGAAASTETPAEGTPDNAVIDMHHIGNCSIEHLATRGGVVRKGSTIHDVVRAFIKSNLVQILKAAIIRVHYRRAVTINDSDIRFALNEVGVNYIFHREKPNKSK
jgi:histone H3/H4